MLYKTDYQCIFQWWTYYIHRWKTSTHYDSFVLCYFLHLLLKTSHALTYLQDVSRQTIISKFTDRLKSWEPPIFDTSYIWIIQSLVYLLSSNWKSLGKKDVFSAIQLHLHKNKFMPHGLFLWFFFVELSFWNQMFLNQMKRTPLLHLCCHQIENHREKFTTVWLSDGKQFVPPTLV